MTRPRQPTSILEAKGAFKKNPSRYQDYGVTNEGGRPVAPKTLTGRAREIFLDYLGKMPWLIAVDTYPLAQYAALAAQWEENHAKFQVSKFGAMRTLEKQLGAQLIDRTTAPKATDAGNEFFDA